MDKPALRFTFMNTNFINRVKKQKLVWALWLPLMLFLFGNAPEILAHGGEDHGDAKPKVAATEKGIVSRSAKLGDYEVTLKTPTFEPDTASSGRLFITKFETNEAFGEGSPAVEIESSNGGAIEQAAVEKTDAAGSYSVKIPALPEGNYTVRVSLKTAKGGDTATFSNVEVAHSAGEIAVGSASSWLGAILLFLAGAVVLGLFGSLFYFAWRMAGEKRIGEETISA